MKYEVSVQDIEKEKKSESILAKNQKKTLVDPMQRIAAFVHQDESEELVFRNFYVVRVQVVESCMVSQFFCR